MKCEAIRTYVKTIRKPRTTKRVFRRNILEMKEKSAMKEYVLKATKLVNNGIKGGFPQYNDPSHWRKDKKPLENKENSGYDCASRRQHHKEQNSHFLEGKG